MYWIPLYVALAVWGVIVFRINRDANQRTLEARLSIDEANALSREQLKQMTENNKLLKELNALLRAQK